MHILFLYNLLNRLFLWNFQCNPCFFRQINFILFFRQFDENFTRRILQRFFAMDFRCTIATPLVNYFDGKKQGLHWKFHKNSLFSKLYRNSFCKNLKLALNLLSLSSLDLYSGMRLGKSSCDKSKNPQNVKRTQNILYLYHPSVVWTIHCDR